MPDGGARGICALACNPPAAGDCARGLAGIWTGVPTLSDCTARCEGCAQCHYVSHDRLQAECLWYRNCEEGEACYVVSAERRTDCRAEGTGTRGSACRAANDCAAGFYCQERMDRAGTCVRLCALDAPECPEAEGRCQEFALIPAGLGLCQEAATARE